MPDINYPLEGWKAYAGPFPLLCFVDNAYGAFSLAVKTKTHGPYGHFMYLIGKDQLASQWWYFQRQTLDHYKGAYIKFVGNPSWTDDQRDAILKAINKDLDKPWYQTLYDVPGVIGEWLGIPLNLPGFDFCSERGRYLPGYDLKHPSPVELDLWTRKQGGYKVIGLYNPGLEAPVLGKH
jgi:hypothetical protein